MVDTIKFSQFTDGGTLGPNQTTVGLNNAGTINTRFLNAFPLLPPGPTGDRPAPDPQMYGRLRLNTQTYSYEYYNPTSNQWIQVTSSIDLGAQPFVTYTSSPELSSEFNLGSLTSGILKQTVLGGISTPSIAVNGTDFYGPGFTGFLSSPSGVRDIHNNNVVRFDTQGASAVNFLVIRNNAAGFPVVMESDGTDTDIGFSFLSKAAGSINFGTEASTGALLFLSGPSRQHITSFNFPSSANTRIVTWQDAAGTVAYLSDIPPSATGQPLTRVDDTNVTVTLGGSPATALVNPASLTMGWSGQLSLTRGGTNKSLVASNGGIVYTDSDSMEVLSGTATASQLLLSGSSSAPSWSTNTFPSSSVVNSLLYASASNVISDLSTANSAILRTTSGGIPGWTASMTNGQIVIGSTGGTPSAATLTVNSPLSIVNAANSITLSSSSFSSVVQQQFTASGTYTPTSGMKYCIIEVWGSGAAGGGTPTAAAANGASASGGGSGGYSVGVFTSGTIGASQSVTIAAGGTGVSNGNGNNGGTSSVGALITANGGGGGLVSGAATVTSFGVAGGVAATAGSGGTTNATGNPGSYSFWTGTTVALSGSGGSSPILGGAGRGAQAVGANVAGGSPAANSGSGGAGSCIQGVAGANSAGAAGAAGRVIVTEFI